MTNIYVNEDGNPWAPVVFNLPADTENEIMFQVAERIKQEIWADIEIAIPEFRLPLAIQPSRERRLEKYTAATDPIDFAFLRDPQYLKKHQDGLYPPLVSLFWLDLMDMPPVFEYIQRDFMRLTKFIEDADDG